MTTWGAFLLTLVTFVASAAATFVTGAIDRRLGYDSQFKHLCTMAGITMLASAFVLVFGWGLFLLVEGVRIVARMF